jgi:hypothetical protein
MRTFSTISDHQLVKKLKANIKERKLDHLFMYMGENAKHFYKQSVKKSLSEEKYFTSEEYKKLISPYIQKDKKIAVICLGCGNAEREASLLADYNNIDIICVDSSRSMLNLANKTLKKYNIKNAFFIESDFRTTDFKNDITSFTKEYDYRIFTCIGGTLGSVSQTDIADTFYNLLGPSDYMWVDCMTRSSLDPTSDISLFNRLEKIIFEKNRRLFWLYPLQDMGINIDKGRIAIHAISESSVGVLKFTFCFEFTEYDTILMRGEVIHFRPQESIPLSLFRVYHIPTMISFFESSDLKLIKKQLSETNGQLIFQKGRNI